MNIKSESGRPVQTAIGIKYLDNSGAAVGAARIDPAEAYSAGPLLLKEHIDAGSEKAWQEIRRRVDNVYHAVSRAMEALDAAEPFTEGVRQLLDKGKKLFFKPNLVNLPSLDPATHGPVAIGTCLPWEFLAALMRWFHDKCEISYHRMAIGEAGTFVSLAAFNAAKAFGIEKVTTQALMEGKCGDHYGGWGFYFVGKYLAECHQPGHQDDPLAGYEESLAGICLPPGRVNNRLLVYDLNKIADDMSNGREVPVRDGINYQSIIIHKAVIGGDPRNPHDREDWPGCVLVNVAKLKIHVLELLTAAIKNIGIGLYPMELNLSREPGKYRWKYALPDLKIPIFKMKIPHSRWVVQYDEEAVTPLTGPDGGYVWKKTGGMQANMADIIQAVRDQGVRMVHVVDAIETTNIQHSGIGAAAVPEGFVFAGHDPVALDTCCARYLFNMMPLAEAEEKCREYHPDSDVVRPVSLPEIKGKNIVNGSGYDSAFSRYGAFKHFEDRGIGARRFFVTGKDLWQGGSLVSLDQHLGRVQGGTFTELLTGTLYYTPNKVLWDFQMTCLKYLELEDKLTGSDFRRQVMETFGENGDGVIDYLETGRGDSQMLTSYGLGLAAQSLDPFTALELRFLITTTQLRRLKKEWNKSGRSLGEQALMGQAVSLAFAMSQAGEENHDPFYPGRSWGKGKWPGMKLVLQRQIGARVYGPGFPDRFDVVMSPYGCAFRYADGACGGPKYCTDAAMNQDMIGNYHRDVARGAGLLPFTFYVPQGLGLIGNFRVPNVIETDDPDLMFTAVFDLPEGKKVWKDLKIKDYDLK